MRFYLIIKKSDINPPGWAARNETERLRPQTSSTHTVQLQSSHDGQTGAYDINGGQVSFSYIFITSFYLQLSILDIKVILIIQLFINMLFSYRDETNRWRVAVSRQL